MKRLIVHADDFNLTPGVNQGILEAFRNGVVRSTSIMINLPGAEASARQLREARDLDVGLHANLTMGRPLTQAPSLVDESGAFRRKPSLQMPHLRLDEAEREIRAQLRRCAELGITLSHMDSHHHLHEAPELARMFIRLAREHGIALRSYDDARHEVRKAGVPTPDAFVVDFYGGDTLRVDYLVKRIETLPEGTSELCCHPARVDDALRRVSSYAEPRADELKVLCDADVKRALEQNGVELVGFADL